MKKVYLFLVLIPAFIAYKSSGMGYQLRKPAKTEWEELIATDPSILPTMDAFLRKEVETYRPGFVRWNWQPISSPRGSWRANFPRRTISIPYYDLLLISKYLQGAIPKQAIKTRLGFLHHEITHLVKQHDNIYHPSSDKYTSAVASLDNPNLLEETKINRVEQASQALMQNEREADYGIPNNPDFTQAMHSYFSYLSPSQPQGPLVIKTHPQAEERAQTMENRSNKLRIGKMMSTGNVTFAGEKLPHIQGTSPLKAAKLLGVEDTDYYQSLSKKDHPLEIIIISGKNNEPITFPYAATRYSENLVDFLKGTPKNSMTFSFNIQELIKDFDLEPSDLALLEKILTSLDASFQESLLYHEVIERFNWFYMLNSSIQEKAHVAALAALFKIKIIDQALLEYYKNTELYKKKDRATEINELAAIINNSESPLLRYGAQHIIEILQSIAS